MRLSRATSSRESAFGKKLLMDSFFDHDKHINTQTRGITGQRLRKVTVVASDLSQHIERFI